MARSRPPAVRRLLLALLTALAVGTAGIAVVAADRGTPATAPAAATAAEPPDDAVPSAAAEAAESSAAAASAAAASAAAASAAADAAAAAEGALAAVGSAAAGAGGSIAVVVLAADGSTVLSGPSAGTPVYTASLVKLLVVQQLLQAAERGRLTLTAADLGLLQRAVEASDDDAMDSLWVRFDGPALVTAAAAEFGLTGTASTSVTGQWGESTTTAHDYAAFLAALPGSLDAADATRLTGWMRATTDAAADGFDQDFGVRAAGVLTTGAVAAKQGWMCCVDATRQLHSAGVLADGRVVVLLGDFPTSTSWARAQAALDAAAVAVLSRT